MSAHQGWPRLPEGALAAGLDSILRLTGRVRLSSWLAKDLFILAELALVTLAALVAKWVYLGIVLGGPEELTRFALVGLLGALITFVVSRGYGLYGAAELLEGKASSTRLVLATSFSFMLLLTLAYVAKVSDVYSRGWLLLWYALSCASVVAARQAFPHAHRWLVGRGVITHRVAIVADTASAHRLVTEMRANPEVEIAGVFAGDDTQSRESVADLIRLGRKGLVDEIIVVLQPAALGEQTRLVDALSVLPVDIRLYTDQIPKGIDLCEVHRAGNITLLGVARKPVREWGNLVKLIEDYVLASVALVLLAPLLAVIALAVKLDSPGPVFFRQRRHGYNHRVIRVFKFRTMNVLEDGDKVVQARKDDGRITRVGIFLRRTSLDELPQLLNVLSGEMSLVGPRPHALAHNDHYAEIIEGYAQRHRVKPGITGWAQVNGFRGLTDTPELMRQRMEYDLHYIESWSLWLDFEIMIRTVIEVLRADAH